MIHLCEIISSGSPNPNFVKSARLFSSVNIHWRPFKTRVRHLQKYKIIILEGHKHAHTNKHVDHKHTHTNIYWIKYTPSVQTNPGRMFVIRTWKRQNLPKAKKTWFWTNPSSCQFLPECVRCSRPEELGSRVDGETLLNFQHFFRHFEPLCFESFSICVHLSEYFVCVLNIFANKILKENCIRIADLGRQLFRCRLIYSQCALIRDPEENDVGRRKNNPPS